MAFVYWIHLPEHIDMLSEGYIGITTKTLDKRFKRHKSDAKAGSKLHVHRAVLKYSDNVMVSALLEGDIEYCKDVEYKLRPLPNIGWNTGVGGQAVTLGVKPDAQTRRKMGDKAKINKTYLKANEATRGRKQPQAEKDKRADSLRGQKRTEESRERIKLGHDKKKPWQRSRTNLDILSKALEAFSSFSLGHTWQQTEKALSIPYKSLQHTFVKFKSGWNPQQDSEFLEWLKTYKIKECPNGT